MSFYNNTFVRFLLEETDDKGDQQLMRGKSRNRETLGGPKHKLVRLNQYGFSGNPPKGAQGIATFMNGNPDQGLLIGIEHPDHRPKDLPVGDSKMYDDVGQYVWLKHDGTVEIFGGGSCKITMTGGKIYLDGDVYIGGGPGATFKPTSQEGTIDSDGDVEVSNFATKVHTR